MVWGDIVALSVLGVLGVMFLWGFGGVIVNSRCHCRILGIPVELAWGSQWGFWTLLQGF